jgi:hypothetical protein
MSEHPVAFLFKIFAFVKTSLAEQDDEHDQSPADKAVKMLETDCLAVDPTS